MLVIMKYRNIQACFQSFFYFKATWSTDILKINSSKGRRNPCYCFDDFFCVLRFQTNRNRIHISKFFKKCSFSFHNRHCRIWPYIPKSQYRTSITYYSNCIRFRSVCINCFFILRYFFTRCCYTRCIQNRQVFF